MSFRKPILFSAVLSIASLAGLAPSTAQADLLENLRVRVDIGRPAPQTCVQRVWVEPVYETRCEKVWVAPVYQTQCDRVWHEPVYQDQCQRVLIPDQFQVRDVVSRDYNGRVYHHAERVLVTPAHYEDRHSQVLVAAGYFEDVQRQVCVTVGRWIDQPQQVCVSEGHWAEQVIEQPAPRRNVDWQLNIGGSRDDHHDEVRHDDDDRHDRNDRYADYRADRNDDGHGRDPRVSRDDTIGRDHEAYNKAQKARNDRSDNSNDRGRRY